MDKHKVITELKKRGFKNWEKKFATSDSWYFVEYCGDFKVYILLSNSVRVLIETDTSYCVTFHECTFSFKDIETSADITEIKEAFDLRVKAVKALEDIMAT